MKVLDILNEARSYMPQWADKGEFQARIVLGSSYDAPNRSEIPPNALKKLEKEARIEFTKMVDKHPTNLRFKSVTEANAYLMKMDMPNWPLQVEKLKGYGGKIRGVTINVGEVKEPDYDDIKIEPTEDGWYKVHVEATVGRMLNVIASIAYDAQRQKTKFKVKMKSGMELPTYITNFRSNTILIKPKNLADLEKIVHTQKGKHKVWNDKRDKEIAYSKSEEGKKARNKANYADQKARKESLYATYGKAIVDRVKIKPMSHEGDDGYQWAMFVDGRRIKSGMTQYQAYGEQEMYWNYLLKVSKMTPEEIEKEAKVAEGMRLYFMYDYLEKHMGAYLNAISKNAKKVLKAKKDAEKTTNDAIDKAKVTDEAQEQYDDLMKRLRKKMDK